MIECPITLGKYEELQRQKQEIRLYEVVCEHCFKTHIFKNHNKIVGELVFKCECGEEVLVYEEDFIKIDKY